MNTKPTVPIILGFLALSTIVISSFLPWFRWSFHEGTQSWPEKTDVWGPPAVIYGMPYASVDVSAHGITSVNWAAGITLVLFFLGIVLWVALLWVLRREIKRRIVLAVVGAASIVVSGGLVVILGLAGLIAQRVGLYAAVQSSRIVVAELAGLQAPGPLMLAVGVVAEAGVLVWRMCTKRT
jgi:hypothetical protein